MHDGAHRMSSEGPTSSVVLNSLPQSSIEPPLSLDALVCMCMAQLVRVACSLLPGSYVWLDHHGPAVILLYSQKAWWPGIL